MTSMTKHTGQWCRGEGESFMEGDNNCGDFNVNDMFNQRNDCIYEIEEDEFISTNDGAHTTTNKATATS